MSEADQRTHLANRLSDDPNLYRHLIENTLDIVTIVDDYGQFAYQSMSIERTLGYKPEALLGKNIAEFIHPDDLLDVHAAIERIHTGALDVDQAEFRFRNSAGTYRYLQGVAQRWDKAGVRGIIVSSRDVTESHEAHVKIAQNNELLAKIFSVSQNLLSISLPGTGQFIEVNDAWCKALGYSREEVIGRTALDLGIWGSVGNREKVIGDLNAQGLLRNYEARAYSRDGKERLLLVDAQILAVADQPRILMSCLDITDARRVEEELRQSQKMEAVGQLTGGVAHDFNNLIGVTMGNAELLMDQIADRPAATAFAQQIFEASQKGANLTHQLLAFSRRQTLAPETVNLGDHLRRLEPMLQTTVSENTRIHIHADENIWPSHVDPNQLETALLNLTLNARDAMPDGGDVHFRVANITVQSAEPRAEPEYHKAGLAAGEYVVLSVEDAGAGMDLSTQNHAFEPFFTTKDTGKGTGLGLSMVFGFAKQSGGAILIDSEVGRGTTMSLLLPRAINEQLSVPRPDKQTGDKGELYHGSNETILVIEDNEPLRKLVTMTLTNLGYIVIEACGEQDLPGVLSDVSSLDLLLCDVILEGRSKGPDLARKVLCQFPQAAVLFMTGYSPGEVLENNFRPVLSKPFTREECSSAVRQTLETRHHLGLQ